MTSQGTCTCDVTWVWIFKLTEIFIPLTRYMSQYKANTWPIVWS